jgi:hypothetical protein
MTRLSVAVVVALLPQAVLADALLDRYQAAAVTKADQMEAFFVARVPELAEVLPEMGWDDELAVVAACILDGQRAERGEAGAEAYVAALEEWALIVPTSFMTMADGMPVVLSDDLALRLNESCGGIEISMQRMQDSGMMAMIQDPAVMERLIAD